MGGWKKIDLEFNVDTLRVTDSGEQNDTSVSDSARQILDKIKNTGTGSSPIVNSGPSQASSTKLKQLLGRLGQNNDMT